MSCQRLCDMLARVFHCGGLFFFRGQAGPSGFSLWLPCRALARERRIPHNQRACPGNRPDQVSRMDRQQFVTRISQNRFAVAENDRWAEPLEENFSRVLS